jgi:hypothetical protein
MSHFPIQVYFEIRSYLKNEEYHAFLLTSNSCYFRSVRKQTILLELSRQSSNRFIEKKSFRDRVLNLIQHPYHQLCLTLKDQPRLDEHQFKLFKELFNLFLAAPSSFSDLSYFHNIQKLTLHNCNGLRACDGLQNVNELYLCYCNKLHDIRALSSTSSLSLVSIKHCPLLTDISPLQNIPGVELVSCPASADVTRHLGGEKQREVFFSDMGIINNFGQFTHLKKLSLFDAELENVSDTTSPLDLSPLTEIESVCLTFWFPVPRICKNFSSLKKASSIFLTQCNVTVSDLSCFNNVISLQLVHCRQVNDLSCLAHISSLRKIFLKWLPQLTDITMLGRLSFVHVYECPIRSLKGLENVRQLILTQCKDLITLEGIKNNRYVTIDSCSQISYFNSICNCPKVLLLAIPFSVFSDIHDLGKIQYLSLSCLIEETFSFPSTFHPHMVALSLCNNLTSIEGLNKVPVVYVRLCNNLTDVSEGLGENHEVVLERCSSIRNISCLSTVPDVRIYDCFAINNYSCLNEVKDLKIYIPNDEDRIVEEIKGMKNATLRKFPLNYYDIFPFNSSY